jgi:ATP-dependent 26S proteasome regulatory subunit
MSRGPKAVGHYQDSEVPLPPKSSADLTDKDWERVLKESKWNGLFNTHVFMKYLDVKSPDDIQYEEHEVSQAYSIVPRYCLEDFLKDEKFTVQRLAWVLEDCNYSVEWSLINIDVDKKVNRVNNGQFFISNGTEKYIFESKAGYHDNYFFKIISRKDSKMSGKELLEKFIKYTEEHNFLKGKKIDPACNFIRLDKTYTWDDIILSEKLKMEIRQNLSNLIEHRSIYRDNGLKVRRGLIFSGPPGVGKTNLIKILCATIDWTLIWVSPKHLENPRRVSTIMQLAKDLSPSVIVLEDIDLYGSSREMNGNPTVLGELMNQLDGVEGLVDIITIATTNNAAVLEKALLDRPGRFDKVITFDVPGPAERLRMLELFAATVQTDNSFTWKELSEKPTDGMSGAQVREVIAQGVIQAVDDGSVKKGKIILKYKHLKEAMKAIKDKDFTKIGIQPVSSSGNGNLDMAEDRW